MLSPNNRNGIETGGENSKQFLIVKNRMEWLGGSSADLISSEFAVTTVYCIGHFRYLDCDTIPILRPRTPRDLEPCRAEKSISYSGSPALRSESK